MDTHVGICPQLSVIYSFTVTPIRADHIIWHICSYQICQLHERLSGGSFLKRFIDFFFCYYLIFLSLLFIVSRI